MSESGAGAGAGIGVGAGIAAAAGTAGTAGRLVLATANVGKVVELRRILAAAAGASSVELIGLDAFPGYPEVAETGETFEENALIKARACVGMTGLASVADDSGLVVDALGGMPGVLSARWAGRHGDDAANLALVLAQVAEIPEERLTAAFVCAAALVTAAGEEVVVRGEVRGHLIRRPRGEGGFGYDPIFVPEGFEQTTAEMTAAEKDAISHRGQAFRALVPHIRSASV